MSTPTSHGVEEYPHQYASTFELADRLKRKFGIVVEREQYALAWNGRCITCEPRKGETGLWFYIDGEPIDPVMSPDAPMRVAAALRSTLPRLSET